MPIKQLKISFNIPLQSLLGFIQASGADMQIDVLGTEPRKTRKALAPPGPMGLLEGPKRAKRTLGDDPGASRNIVLMAIATHKGKNVERTSLKHTLDGTKYKPTSLSNIYYVLQKRGFIETVATGVYRATPEGLKEAHRLMKLKNKVNGHASTES